MSGNLPRWAERLLGIQPDHSGQGTHWTLELYWPWPPWLTLIAVAAAVVWIATIYRQESVSLRRRTTILLASLRIAALAMLLLMLAQATLSLQRTGLPSLVVAVDTSASMSVADAVDGETPAHHVTRETGSSGPSRLEAAKALLLRNNARLIDELTERYHLKLYALDSAARPLPVSNATDAVTELRRLKADGDASRLGSGLRAVLDDLRGTPPAAIVLFTDGVTTEGETLAGAAEVAAREGVPWLAVGLGSDAPVRDVELFDLLVDEVVFVSDVVNFQSTVKSTGLQGKEIELVLRRDGEKEPLARSTLILAADGEPQTVHLAYRPPEPGDFEFTIDIEPLESELQVENNRQQRLVSVREQQIDVLYVQAYPSWEFQYLKTLLERDTTVNLRTVLQDADQDYAQIDRSALPVFPVRRDELFAYDVVIFGDVNPAYLTSSTMDNLRDFVQEKGGGLAFIAGPKFTPYAYRNTPLAGLLPVELGSGQPPDAGDTFNTAFQVRPTELGLAAGTLQLGDSLAESLRLWQELPPLYWMVEAGLKPAARTLAEHPTQTNPDGRPLAIIASHYFGAGKVLFHATDETWRWRLGPGDRHFARYWVQTIRYLARTKLLRGDHGIELTADRREYRQGEPVRIRARFLDERHAPAADDGVAVVAEQQGQQRRHLTLRRNSGLRGIFEGVLTDVSQGNWHVWLAEPAVEERPPSADFLVSAPPGEFASVQMAAAELEAAAATTRGHFYTLDQANDLLDDLPAGRQVPIEPLPPVSLWNRWWMLVVFLGLITTEWILRKKCRLL
ncbi:MAG: VWA domain-containing protein [Pirellulales bacterium]